MRELSPGATEDVETTQGNGPTIDVALEKHIGELGKHQLWLFSIVSAAWMPGALMVLNMAFFGARSFGMKRRSVDSVALDATRRRSRAVHRSQLVSGVLTATCCCHFGWDVHRAWFLNTAVVSTYACLVYRDTHTHYRHSPRHTTAWLSTTSTRFALEFRTQHRRITVCARTSQLTHAQLASPGKPHPRHRQRSLSPPNLGDD